jgi:hypothetical protein
MPQRGKSLVAPMIEKIRMPHRGNTLDVRSSYVLPRWGINVFYSLSCYKAFAALRHLAGLAHLAFNANLNIQSATDTQYLPGNIRRHITRQKQCGISDLFGFAKTAEWNFFEELGGAVAVF